jgi:NAD(P)H-hydrate epimerase
VFPLPEIDGMLSQTAIDNISTKMRNMDAVLIGPGLGVSPDTYAVTEFILSNFNGPVVLDADGINVLAGHKDILRGRTAPTIITPHEGEFTRIGGDLSAGRIDGACRLSQDLGCIVVLKGHETVITDGDEIFLNSTGNPGMAVGGSGDVLAGVIASLVGQRIEPVVAAAISVWLHGRAGDICANELGQYGMLPSDMLNVIPRLMK